MSNIQTGAERMPHVLSHLCFLAGQSGRLITISTTPVIAGDYFEMDAVGALRLSPLRRGLAIDSTVDIFTFYVPHRNVYGDQWIKFLTHGVNDTWCGEAGLVRWGSGNYADQGWIRYNRHAQGANYIYADAHVEFLHWRKARLDQYPDHVVRFPLAHPPE